MIHVDANEWQPACRWITAACRIIWWKLLVLTPYSTTYITTSLSKLKNKLNSMDHGVDLTGEYSYECVAWCMDVTYWFALLICTINLLCFDINIDQWHIVNLAFRNLTWMYFQTISLWDSIKQLICVHQQGCPGVEVSTLKCCLNVWWLDWLKCCRQPPLPEDC